MQCTVTLQKCPIHRVMILILSCLHCTADKLRISFKPTVNILLSKSVKWGQIKRFKSYSRRLILVQRIWCAFSASANILKLSYELQTIALMKANWVVKLTESEELNLICSTVSATWDWMNSLNTAFKNISPTAE